MQTYPIYFNGKFQTTNQILEVRNPYSKELVALTYLAGNQEFDVAVNAAVAAEAAMAKLPSYKRFEILCYCADRLRADRERLATVLASESGKPMRYALGEIDRSSQTLLVAAEESKRLPKEYISLDWTPAGTNREGLIKHFPVGTIAAIAPFNFPMNLAMHKIAPAIAAGCPIVLKPARTTPLSVLEFAKIISETDLPAGALSIIPTDRTVGNRFVTDSRFKMLTFTGSPEVGWAMKAQAGSKKITLELGGNAGVIVSESADLEDSVTKCVSGSFAFSGQVCIHVQRIYVHKNIFQKFTEKFAEKTSKLKVGDPLASDTDISVMIDEENALRVEAWVNDAVADGAKILHGGKRQGNYFEPTVLTNTKPQMNVCALEIFGPVVSVEPCDSVEDAVAKINNSQYGLQAGIFTDSQREINFAFENLHVGGVIVNDVPSFRVDHMPYGGVKNSGFGREGIRYAIAEMTEPRLLVKPIL